MPDGKVFTKETKQNLRQVLDDVVALKGWKELLSDIGLWGVVEAVDYFGDKIVPDQYDESLNNITALILAKDYDAAGVALGDLLNVVIDIPVLDETQEEFVFKQGLQFIISILKNYIAKKQG